MADKAKEIIFEHFKNWGDYYFYFFSVLIGLTSWCYLSNEAGLNIQDTAQILIVFTTFTVLFHSVFIKDNFSSYRKRPVIDISLNFKEPDCHLTETHIRFPLNEKEIGFIEVPTYYLRLRVHNIGKSTLNNVEAILEKVEMNGKELTSFLPITLIWALTEVQSNRGITQIPQGTFRTLDLVHLLEPERTKKVPDERYQALAGNVGVCSVVKPNTYSDILTKGNYTLYLSIVSENQEPYFAKMLLKYNGKWDDSLSSMFKNNLILKLVAKGKSKQRVYEA